MIQAVPAIQQDKKDRPSVHSKAAQELREAFSTLAFLKNYGKRRRSGRQGRLTQEHIAAMSNAAIAVIKHNKDVLGGIPVVTKIVEKFQAAARKASIKAGYVGLAELYQMKKDKAPKEDMAVLAREVRSNFEAAGSYSSVHSTQRAFIGEFLNAGLH